MAAMSHRERIIKALDHEEPDRVPIDMGSLNSGVDSPGYGRLAKYLGMEEELRRPELKDPSVTVVPGQKMAERFGIDTRPLVVRSPQEVKEQLDEVTYRDEWCVLWKRTEGGPYMNKMGPFQEEEPSLADLDRFPWPDPEDPSRVEGLRESARKLHEETDYAVVLSIGNGVVALCQRLRGFTEWMEDLVLQPTVAEAMEEYVTEVIVGVTRAALRVAGPYVDVVWFGDDLGIQDRPYFRPELYRSRIKAYHRRLVDAIKSESAAKVVLHTDGSIYPLIQDFIDIGIDAINPVQVSAKDMDTKRLKAEFGDRMGFWGGIDTQHVLPFGSPDDVTEEVQTRIRDLAPGGGYVLASVHTIRPEVPPQNIVAMAEAALEYGRY
ncbi:MAG: uroporphyrinogen decarboxylase family protein [Dehalococcoidia bacterium]